MGTTQYIDAFQRANFWSTSGNPSHLLLGGPTVLPTQTLNVGNRVRFVRGIGGDQLQLQTLLINLGITPDTIPDSAQ
jgi:hypothetical protein